MSESATVAVAQATSLELVESAKEYAKAAKSPRTREAYRRELLCFVAWCESRALVALPAEPSTVALYLTAEADRGRKPAGLDLALAALSEAHRAAGYASPRAASEVRAVRSGIRRRLGTRQVQKAPLSIAELRAVVENLTPNRSRNVRARALILLGFAGALRRSELAALHVEDVAFKADGVEVTIRRSKVDQEGAGATIGVPFGSDPLTCPVRALRAYLDRSGRTSGVLFGIAGPAIARTVKRAVKAAGLDPARFSGHSLRAGLATAAAKAGKAERVIQRHGRWTNVTMVRRYIRDADLWTENAATGIGL